MNELIQKAMQRDVDSFMELINSTTEQLYKTATAMLSSEEDVVDAVQETILTAWEKIGHLRNPASFKSWIIRILINKCNDQLRKREILTESGELPEQAVPEPGYERGEWAEILARLDEHYRLVLALYYVEDFSAKEIAKLTGLKESAVRTRLKRGREKLLELYLDQEKRGQDER